MTDNIIEQVKTIESEADRIIAEAKEKADEMGRSVEGELSDLREERKKVYGTKLDEAKQEIESRTRDRIESMEKEAARAEENLDSLDKQNLNEAVDRIVSRLCEEK